MDVIPAAARAHAHIRRGAAGDALCGEADTVAVCGEFRGEAAADYGGRVDGGVCGYVESGGDGG